VSIYPDHPLGGPDAVARFAAARIDPDRDVTERDRSLRSFAGEVRRAISELMTTTAPEEAVDEAAHHVARAVELLAGQAHGRPYEGVAESSISGDPRAFADFSPIAGPTNPLAPPLTMEMGEEGVVVATAEFGDAYEGPPGNVHGGYVAACFDEVCGFAQSMTGRPGMTGRLVVHYRRPTPLHQALRFEGRVDRVEGRKIFTVATLRAGDVLCAEAEALFISVDPAVFERMMADRGANPAGG
jgi:acyl-coenzyme A thioesterase PaaI-like protein